MDELLTALENALEARKKEKDARESYKGYNWGYHGYYDTKRKREAEEDLRYALREAVERVFHEIQRENEYNLIRSIAL